MKKHLKLEKRSFTLLETLISTILLSVIIVGFSQYSYYDNFEEEFILLNKIENSFNTKIYNQNFTKTSKNITIIKNNSDEKSISVKVLTYKNEKIELFKYEL
jgi:amino acid permease